MAHTKGPWEETGDSYPQAGNLYGPDGVIVASVQDVWRPESPANRKLIAAAPDLLRAAELLIDHYERSVDVGPPFDADVRSEIGKWQLLKMAVLTAKGETE